MDALSVNTLQKIIIISRSHLSFLGAIILVLVFSFLLLGRRQRRRTVINGSARQYQSKPICGGSQGRSQFAPYGPQGVAQALYGNAPPVRSDDALYNADYYSQGSPAPPAYVNDTNVKGGYSPVSINTYMYR